jgi:polar amino acid transport system substrate-binding protein
MKATRMHENNPGGANMNKTTFRKGINLLFISVFCLSLLIMPALAEETVFVENEWGFVDQSIDISHGIPDDASGVLDRIRRNGVLRVATEPYFAPQEFIDPEKEGQNQFVGADMKLAALIADRMGVRLEVIPMDFTDVLPALAEDKCDLTVSAIAFTPGRAGAYTLSKGYYFTESEASTTMMIREADKESITSLEDLSKKILAAQSTSLQESLAIRHVNQYAEFRRLSSVQDVYDAIKNGTADAGFVDMETAQNYIKNNPGSGLMLVSSVQFALEEQDLGDRICAKKGELQLICFVNGVIDEVIADGSYDRWIEEAQKRAAELGL